MPAARAAAVGKSALEASSLAALACGCLQEALVLRGLSSSSRVVSGVTLGGLETVPSLGPHPHSLVSRPRSHIWRNMCSLMGTS